MNEKDFKIGDKVAFKSTRKKYVNRLIGKIVKLNPKRAKVYVLVGTTNIGTWQVPYELLDMATKEEIGLLAIEILKTSKFKQ